jgi:hypothetical protein
MLVWRNVSVPDADEVGIEATDAGYRQLSKEAAKKHVTPEVFARKRLLAALRRAGIKVPSRYVMSVFEGDNAPPGIKFALWLTPPAQ